MHFKPTKYLNVCTILAATAVGCSSDVPDDPSATAGSAGTLGSAGAPGAGGSGGAVTTAGAAGSVTQSGGNAGGSAAAGGSSGGTSGGAGLGGSASGGASGMTGSGGSGGGASTKTPSAGCSAAAGQALASWVEQPKLKVNGTDRQWWVWLPTGYDPTKAYPVVFTFHGCGSADNFVPMEKTAGKDAILVRGAGITGGCWTYGATGDDVKFFDAMLADVEAKRCADTSRVFTTGYSSGSWLVNTLNCERGDKLRGSGSVSGGVAVNTASCPGSENPATPAKPREYARIFIHDADDMTNKFMGNGNDKELARIVKANHCTDAAPVAEDPAPCKRYQGCDSGEPVLFCQTMGKGHDRQDTLATTAFWKLFSSL